MHLFKSRIKFNQIFSCVFVFTILVLPLSVNANKDNPGKIVKNTIDQVLVVLDDKSLSEKEKQQYIYQAVTKQIDFNSMSRRILASNWEAATNQQKADFVFLFEKILLNDYWARIKNYRGERVEYYAVSIDREKYATVDTVIIRDGSNVEIPITYRMELKDDNWKAYDFLVESLSLVQNYRREYQAIIKNHGIQGLLEQMHTQI